MRNKRRSEIGLHVRNGMRLCFLTWIFGLQSALVLQNNKKLSNFDNFLLTNDLSGGIIQIVEGLLFELQCKAGSADLRSACWQGARLHRNQEARLLV